MKPYFETRDLAVGYNGHILIHDIDIQIEKGKILTLIGPNGAGKSTILKTITRHLVSLHGTVHIGRNEISAWTPREMEKQVAVVLTGRIRPELMTCAEVVAMGRYPYTNMLGRLSPEDKRIVEDALRRVHAMDLAGQDFSTLSDGQRQRILLARAICQQPEVIVLDEPTAYLDIRHKIELLDILREMAQEKNITVIMSLHEIDLAAKISDYLICVKGETIAAFGTPEDVLKQGAIEALYDIQSGSYNLLFGSVELSKPAGTPKVSVIAGNGCGVACYRALQKKQIPFATGILFENDVDTQVARALSDHVITAPAFEPMGEPQFSQAVEMMLRCEAVIDAGTAIGSLNAMNGKLLALAKEKHIPIYRKEAPM